VLMDVIIVLALLEKLLVQIIHVYRFLAELTLIVLLDFIVPKNLVMINKVLAVLFPKFAPISSNQFVVVTTKLTITPV